MRWWARYALSLMPAMLVAGFWLFAEWARTSLSCTGYGKELFDCPLFGFNIAKLVHIGLWFKFLLPLAIALSVGWVGYIAFSQVEAYWKARGKRNATHTFKD
jgi:hypothetical protein